MESGTDDDENDTTVETGDDVRVHDEELSSNTNEEVGEGCSQIAKRKLELEVEEVKPDIKKSKVAKKGKGRKTKLEQSISMLSDSFKDAAEQEMEMLVKLEQIRHKEMLEHEIRMKELDNVRRREERQHELLLLNILSSNRNPYPPQRMDFYQGSNSGSESSYFEL